MDDILPVVLAIFLFFLIPLTICAAVLLSIRPKSAGRQVPSSHPRPSSGRVRQAPLGWAWNNPFYALPTAPALSTYIRLQIPTAALLQIRRSLSNSPYGLPLPNDAEAGVHLQELVDIRRIEPAPIDTYRYNS
ncbi:hypothetical protein B0H19DRAFT_386834 [Mycena capillaripes]|nr:hypothetical protein B0H19DRAFT_386834 [Mycena capillaripes]